MKRCVESTIKLLKKKRLELESRLTPAISLLDQARLRYEIEKLNDLIRQLEEL